MAAAAMARAIVASSAAAAPRFSLSLLLSRRFSSSSSSLSPFRNLARRFTPDARVLVAQSASRLNQIRCRVNRSGDSGYSPLNSGSGSGYSDRPPTEMAPLFPGCDYEHWLIVMDKPGGEGATKQQMIDCYVQTLAKVVGR